ncbi:gliding motility-associated peptidyl-prolyl isomerase GldI [Dokdonia sp. Hel_I_53]|uniref:gliding motility-associated peptidyl-prolyl isomerase GldI n=1 Tax=Dokdonia sp. Hel_I_53 TaxID=1566287 RepID=UPI00119B96F8|nr:gliding motility-associated peptidyl-prolyl isomerase GldI [Dokdonia sp. Hel_I_53]TVZ53425.1 protein involved in gliding motility GldI [Dokdonia sp. Hel_I_53]
MMRILIFICFIFFTSCADQVAREPVSQKSGSYINKSVQRNKDLIAQEEKAILNLIKKDTSKVYESSPNGFWYTYIQKDTLGNSAPQIGDLVLFNYNIATLQRETLVSQEEIGNTVTQIDQSNQELISGIREGLKLMKEGETVTFLFPSHKAYGYYGLDGKIRSNIPIQSTVTLLEIKDQTKN